MNGTRTFTPLLAAVATALLLSACTGAATAGDDAGGDKAGGDPAPITLRIGTDDTPGRPGAMQIEQFAQQVDRRSDGQLTIEPVWQAAGQGGNDPDQVVARMVVDGDLDMGMIPARAWDTEGVTSLRALHAPFLVTTDDLAGRIVTSDIADDMLAGLDTLGVTGLALLPEGLRHLFLYGTDATASSALPDLGGKTVRAPNSATSYAALEALGARPDDYGGDRAAEGRAIEDGSAIGAESSFAWATVLPAPTTAIGDVVLFPKVKWIDYFAGRTDQPHVAELVRLIDADTGIALTDVILGEILQGLRDEHTVRRVDTRLAAFDILLLRTLDDFRDAAALYRHARTKGKTIRRTLDCLIATVCIRENCAILHNDRDFDHLAEVTDLAVHGAPDHRTTW
jgi:TRAP-type C4-dicarboxylate transport system substrate-binding protein/predicted nucleic acid-binding protein